MRRFLILLCAFMTTFLAAQDNDFDGKQEDPDVGALQKWLRDKRLVTVKEIGGDLSLSGEVRTEMQATRETKNGQSQRGPSDSEFKPNFAWDIEVNLMLDYHTDRTWAAIKLEFDNDMGTTSGTTNKINLERAYFGGRIIAEETITFDAELGRRNLNNVYDSKVEFSSIFDGVLFRFSKASESVGDFYILPGALIVNDKLNQFAYVVEIGLLRIANTGFFTKYSFADWKTRHFSSQIKNWYYDYQVSQLLLGYQTMLTRWNKFLKIYLAGLINTAAPRTPMTDYKRARLGYYVGFSLGQIKKAKDFAIDANYQYVQAQAVPEFDSGGIKRGNAAGIGLYTEKMGDLSAKPTNHENAVGACNFTGPTLDVLYAFTSNLVMQNILSYSWTLDTDIGPRMHYCQYELEFIYSF